MAYADPKSFDTLEKAQAEIARVYAILDGFFTGVEPILADIRKERADIANLLAETR